MYAYLQRTADGRIAIGGRGVPYRFGSRTDGDGRDRAARTVRGLRAKLGAMFPPAPRARARARVVGGARRAARLVRVGRRRPPAAGLAWAGGYVGEGVAASNLAGRTLRDLILGERQPAHAACRGWGARRARWEPEPLRWAGIRGAYALYRRPTASSAAAGGPRGWRARSTSSARA